MSDVKTPTYTKKDFESDQAVRWCPGCGDYAILAQTQKTMPTFGRKKEDFVLYTSGCFVMGSEILVIFAFQILFGYIYLQIGLIVTVFLAGMLPGAVLGEAVRKYGKQLLVIADVVMIFLLSVFNNQFILYL